LPRFAIVTVELSLVVDHDGLALRAHIGIPIE
jgi:hypothetical protein